MNYRKRFSQRTYDATSTSILLTSTLLLTPYGTQYCHIVKNTLLQTAFLVVLPTGYTITNVLL